MLRRAHFVPFTLLVGSCTLFDRQTTLSGSIELRPGVEHVLTLHAGDDPVRATLTNRGPAPATVAFDTAPDAPETRQELAAGNGVFELESDGGSATLRLRSAGTATVEYSFVSPHGCRLDWQQR